MCGEEVTSTQVYNHPRKWRARWISVSKLKDLSGPSWDQNTLIVLEDHPKDAKLLNTPIQNYNQMQHILSFGLATGKNAMGSMSLSVRPCPSSQTPRTQRQSLMP